MKKGHRALLALFTSAAVFSTVGIMNTSAFATPTELPIVLDLQNLSSFEDTGGNPVSIVSDSATDTLRTIDGTVGDGKIVAIRVYSGDTDTITAGDLIGLVDATVPPVDDLTPVDVDPAHFSPKVAVATTSTTITVTWLPPAGADEFELWLDDELVQSGAQPNFTLVGMQPHEVFALSMRSSHTPAVPPLPDPIAQCAETTTVHTTDLGAWNLTETRAAGHNEIVEGGLHVYTDEATSQGKAAGYFATSIPLSDVGTPQLDWLSSTAMPGIQLVTDFNGDSTPDGILVGESVYGGDYWLSNASAPFVKTGAPSHTPGFGSQNHGLLSDWVAAFPAASVLAVGYSLGSGVLSDGIIRTMIVGCTYYTFGLALKETTIDSTMTLSVSTQAEAGGSGLGRGNQTSSTAATPIRSTEFNYRTFIPYPTLSESPNFDDRAIELACIAGNSEMFPDEHGPLSFVGDNRSFAAPRADAEPDYRTMMDFRYDWQAATFTYAKDAGATQIVDLITHDILVTDYASTGGMVFTDAKESTDYFAVTFNHVANDPFCPHLGAYGSITYKAKVEMYRSGLVSVTGLRANMPAHEGWVRWNDETQWSNVFALNANRLACLVLQGVPGWNIATDCIGPVLGKTARSLDKWATISSEGRFGDAPTLASTKSGQTYGWGSGHGGILSPFSANEWCTVNSVARVPWTTYTGNRKASTILSGPWNGTVVTRDGKVLTWGQNAFDAGNLGRAGAESLAIPVSTSSFLSVASTDLTTYAVSSDGDLYTWGRRLADKWGWPQNPDRWLSPHLVVTGHDFVHVTVADASVLALDASGKIWGYGDNYSGVLGPRDQTWVPTWEQIPTPGVVFSNVAIVANSAMALDSSGRLWSWGEPRLIMDGQAPTMNSTPAPVDTSVRFDFLHGGQYFDAISLSGGLYRIDYSSDPANIQDARVTDPGFDIVYLDGRFAIAASGELLESRQEYDPMTESSYDVWSIRGLPPTSSRILPEVSCSYPG